MTQAEFVKVIEALLSTAHVEYERRQLLAFVASMWPLIEDDTDVTFWAQRFLEGQPTVGEVARV
jgi:hypothetical protein